VSCHMFKSAQRRKWRHRPKVKPRGLKKVDAEEMMKMQNEGKMDVRK